MKDEFKASAAQTENFNEKDSSNQEELNEQDLKSVSGGTSSFNKPRFGGGPVIHTLGPKQDDPNHGGGEGLLPAVQRQI